MSASYMAQNLPSIFEGASMTQARIGRNVIGGNEGHKLHCSEQALAIAAGSSQAVPSSSI